MGGRRGKGEGSIYQRNDGRWVGSIDLGWSKGKRSRKVVSARTRAEVVLRLRELQPVIAQGITPASELLTVGNYLEAWLTTRLPGTIAVRTEMLYARAVHDYINPSIGKVRLVKLAPSDVARMLQELEARNYSPSTRRMARATLRRALRIAEQDGILTRNAASIAEGPKLDHREGRSLTPEEARRFLEAVKDHRLEAAYVLTLSLGLRRGEVLGLSWNDVELREGTVVLNVRRQLIRDKNGIHLSDLKTSGSRRILHLSQPLIQLLEKHRVRQEAEELVRGKRWNNEHELIFTSTIGTPLDPEQFGKTVPTLTKAAGLGHWSIHELRHSCASLLIAREVPLEVVAEQLGHASIRVTKDVYGHLMPTSRAKAAEAMRSVLFDDSVPSRSEPSVALATQLATLPVAESYLEPVTRDLVGRPGLDPGTLGLKGHRVHYSLFIRFREPHVHGVLRSVRSVTIKKC
ncbi:MAG: tyrosine-type recombinase/integrase [Acidimicrobiales bacterium]